MSDNDKEMNIFFGKKKWNVSVAIGKKLTNIKYSWPNIWNDCVYKCVKTVTANVSYFTCFLVPFERKPKAVRNLRVEPKRFDIERASYQW